MARSGLAKVLLMVTLSVALCAGQQDQQASPAESSPPSGGLFNIRPLSIFTGHCNASIARGATVWKPVPGIVDIFFPKVKPPRCANPSACSMINSSLHANVILQPGDSLRLTFDLDSTSSDISTTSTASSIDIPMTTNSAGTTPSEDTISVDNPAESTRPVLLKRIPRQSPIVASTSTSTSSSPTTPAALPIQKSNVVAERIKLMAQSASDTTTSTTGRPGSLAKKIITSSPTGSISGSQPVTTSNIVTLYKVNDLESFESCDIGGGQRIGQVKSTNGQQQDNAGSSTGVVTLPPTLLSIEDNYFLGRSVRWGGECLKIKVSVKTANCGDRDLCNNNGICHATSSMASFQCSCCESSNLNEFCGPSNLCAYNPCQNEGVCIRVQQNKDDLFRCLCLPGYEGKFCEEQFNACDSMVCHNGGSCLIAHDGRAHCSCPTGYVGLHCEEELTGCDSSPCVHGICVDQTHGYRCFCQPGFGGPDCNFEYNECESNPCLNGGTCLDRVGEFQCVCPLGYAGPRCETQVNLCEPNPCGLNQKCIDHGTNISCECIPGLDLALCAEMNSACQPNPCQRGGTCWVSSGTFFCACKPGLTGDRCQETLAAGSKVGEQQQHHDFIRGGIGHYNLVSTSGSRSEMEIKTSLPLHLDHRHSVYVAIGTLLTAIVIVVVALTVCYCRARESPAVKWSPTARLPFLSRDYRISSSSPVKEDHGMDVPLAVAMESQQQPDGAAVMFGQQNKHKFESLHPTRCQVYWSESRRDAAVLD